MTDVCALRSQEQAILSSGTACILSNHNLHAHSRKPQVEFGGHVVNYFTIARNIARKVKRLARARRQIRKTAHYLQPGIYFLREGHWWYRLGSTAAPNGRATSGINLKTVITRAVAGLVWVSQEPGSTFRGNCLQIRHRSHSIVLWHEGKAVARVIHKERVARNFESNRKALQQFIGGPKFCVSETRDAVLEELIYGVPLRSQDDDVHVQAAEVLIGRMIGAAGVVQTQSSPAERFLRWSSRIDWPVLLSDSVTSRQVAELVRVPAALSHGDLHGSNVLLRATSGELVVIDWDPRRLSSHPYWFDPLSLLFDDYFWSGGLRTPLLDAFWAGLFDASLCALSTVWERPQTELTENRRAIAATWVLYSVFQYASNSPRNSLHRVAEAVFSRAR